MQRSTIPLAAAIAALGVSACHPVEHRNPVAHAFDHRPYTVDARLTCPASVGRLDRTAMAADGQRCDYAGPDAEQVVLTRMDLDGRAPAAALASIETELKSQTGLTPSPDDISVNATSHADANSEDDDSKDEAHVNLPGIHINADHGKADVSVFGVKVSADNNNARISSDWGPYKNTVVHANDAGAEVRAGDVGANGADLVYVLTGRSKTSDWTGMGYMARGPASGPLVVAQFKSKSDTNHHDWRHSGMDDLLRLNVRG
jgi:hypothetical protein